MNRWILCSAAALLLINTPFSSALADDTPDAKAVTLVNDVTFLREEEKLARDVYRTLGAQWNLRIFDNIARAEQRHMDRMKQQLDRLGAPDPVTDDTVGVFVNPKLAALYDQLVKQGSDSELAALTVGATIEDLDIRDIKDMAARTVDQAVLDDFALLECGSRNHMRAFMRQITARGESYVAQFISQADLDAIVQSPQERCGQQARGQGQGCDDGGQGCGGGQGRGSRRGQGPGRRGR